MVFFFGITRLMTSFKGNSRSLADSTIMQDATQAFDRPMMDTVSTLGGATTSEQQRIGLVRDFDHCFHVQPTNQFYSSICPSYSFIWILVITMRHLIRT